MYIYIFIFKRKRYTGNKFFNTCILRHYLFCPEIFEYYNDFNQQRQNLLILNEYTTASTKF